jgi:hypothetical protein
MNVYDAENSVLNHEHDTEKEKEKILSFVANGSITQTEYEKLMNKLYVKKEG